ncbi:MAG: DUF2183 domain-containing protein [Myxococcales bacterium]|nr:DUF2183 domain-containing protein [Myxococcales bacterium]
MARVQVPAVDAPWGVISDIDDTIVHTGAFNALRQVRVVIMNDASTRVPFAGVAAFYRALHHHAGEPSRPFFYVSSSPWNIYDVFEEFMRRREIPFGAMELRDFGFQPEQVGKLRHLHHKVARIERILLDHPTLRFFLVGDSGRSDVAV